MTVSKWLQGYGADEKLKKSLLLLIPAKNLLIVNFCVTTQWTLSMATFNPAVIPLKLLKRHYVALT